MTIQPFSDFAVHEMGTGLADAVSGVDVIVHAASNPLRHTRLTDVGGTRRLLAYARHANVSHFLYVSIVGIDRIPNYYYKHKLAAESLVERSGLPYSIMRATQFHTLMDMLLRPTVRRPFVLLPLNFKFQPIDPGEVADYLLAWVKAGPAGRVPDIGGPEVRTLGELTRSWMAVRRLRKLLVNLPLPGRIAQGFRRGYNTVPESRYGTITWEEWLRSKYGRSPQPSAGART